jgi:hypothetical protein
MMNPSVSDTPSRQQLPGPGGSVFAEVQDWHTLPDGMTFCDVPGVAAGPDDRV